MNRKLLIVKIVSFIFFITTCKPLINDGRDIDKELPILFALQANETSFQIKNRMDIGKLYIQYYEEPEITIGVGETYPKRFYFSALKSIGKYKLRSDLNGVIIDQNEFNFLGNLKDGILIRNDGSIRPGSCSLLDGLSGNVIVDGCI